MVTFIQFGRHHHAEDQVNRFAIRRVEVDRFRQLDQCSVAGFDAGHPRADLLRMGAMYAFRCDKLPKELHSARLVDYAADRLKDMAPMHKWCVKLLGWL